MLAFYLGWHVPFDNLDPSEVLKPHSLRQNKLFSCHTWSWKINCNPKSPQSVCNFFCLVWRFTFETGCKVWGCLRICERDHVGDDLLEAEILYSFEIWGLNTFQWLLEKSVRQPSPLLDFSSGLEVKCENKSSVHVARDRCEQVWSSWAGPELWRRHLPHLWSQTCVTSACLQGQKHASEKSVSQQHWMLFGEEK